MTPKKTSLLLMFALILTTFSTLLLALFSPSLPTLLLIFSILSIPLVLASIYTFRTNKINKTFILTTILLVIAFLAINISQTNIIDDTEDFVTCLQERTTINHSCTFDTDLTPTYTAIISASIITAIIFPLIMFAFILFTRSPPITTSTSSHQKFIATTIPLALIILMLASSLQVHMLGLLTHHAVNIHHTFLDNHRQLAKSMLNNISDSDKIIYSAKDEKYKIHVFTDVDCPYCKKLHREMGTLNDSGITIKYLASPLAQLHPTAQEKMQKIWCATDRKQAMDNYNIDRSVPDVEKCNNPVASQLAISKKLGVRGTPSIFLSDGTNLQGYFPPEELLMEIQHSLK